MSSDYNIHPHAEQQLVDIWSFSEQQWGSKQADKYIDDIYKQIKFASENFSLLKSLPKINLHDIKYFHCNRHYIFAQKPGKKLLILAVLHDSMDIPRRISETLGHLLSIS